jgi:membrane protein
MDHSDAQGPVRIARPAKTRGGYWRRWVRLPLAIGTRLGHDNVSVLAAGVAFYVFLAIPSGLTAIVSVYGLAFNPAQVQSQLSTLIGLLPLDVVNVITSFLQMLAARPQSELGLRLLIGVLISLWSAQSAASAMITALNAVYEKTETRGFLKFELIALLLALFSIVFALASLFLFAVAPLILAWLPLPPGSRDFISLARWPLLTVLVAVAIAVVYRFAPSPESGKRRWGIWGVLLTTVVWIGSSALFALYVANFTSYDASYGSLGAVVVLLLWLYIAVFIVLLGAEVNAELEEREGDQSVPR